MSDKKSSNVVWHIDSVTRNERESLLNQKGCCLWFTGLSGSGKSTIANALAYQLHHLGRHTVVLDGDNVRHGLCGDLGFNDTARVENIRRVSEVAKLFVESGTIVLTAFISPFQQDRALAREKLADGDFQEVFIDCPIEICAQRDPKGLYAKANRGEIKNFTGIDSPYEAPENADFHIENKDKDIDEVVSEIIKTLIDKNIIPKT
jgi:adenylyl-sulfate kinase